MKRKIYILLVSTLSVFVICWGLFSCKEALDLKPEGALQPQQYYRDVHDADAAVLGIYGQVISLAKQYVVLNELRGDLMDVSANADNNLKQLNLHNVSEANPYADPRPFYKVILNCNDALKNFDIMKEQNKILDDDYNQRYSDIVTIRSWLYFQLVTHFGNVPYVTQSFVNQQDLLNTDLSAFPVYSIDAMLDELIARMEELPYKNPYSSINSLNTTLDTYTTLTFFINKNAFLGDLHLWKGNYLQAATYYKTVMMTSVPGVDSYDSYRVKYSEVVTHNDLAVGYIRFAGADTYSLINNNTQGWRSIFGRGDQDVLYNSEWIWALPFDKKFQPVNPLIDLFSRNGSYLVKPSQAAINNWNSQTQQNGFPWDARGRFTYQIQGGQPVIMKYIYTPLDPLQKNQSKWFLTRAAQIHLRFAEAANRDGKIKVAWALLNRGINYTYDPNPGNPNNRDVTDIQITKLPAPYDFDARNNNGPPNFRGIWHRNAGVRGRASLVDVVIPTSTTQDSIVNLETKIIEEAALELAYEGNRWSDLVRIAIRRNDNAFLADKIYQKLLKGGYPEADEVRAKLMDRANWFLPFKMK